MSLEFVGHLHYNGCKVFITSLWTSPAKLGKTWFTPGKTMQNTFVEKNKKLAQAIQ